MPAQPCHSPVINPSPPSSSTSSFVYPHSFFSFAIVGRLYVHHVWSAVSPPSAMRRPICSNSARWCASCEQTAGCAFLLGRFESNLFGTHGPGVEVGTAIEQLRAMLNIFQASWTALHTTAMGRPTDTKLWFVHLRMILAPILTPPAADTVVKVPQMAESITEGTLKQWSKRACTMQTPTIPNTDPQQRSATTLSKTKRSRPSKPTRSTFPSTRPRLEPSRSSWLTRKTR